MPVSRIHPGFMSNVGDWVASDLGLPQPGKDRINGKERKRAINCEILSQPQP
jgi:hypothetical protein